MHIKEELIFSKHSGNLIGFVNLGSVNDLLLRYESSLESGSSDTFPILAKSMLVFMVRGLFTPLQLPYAQFPCKVLSGDLIFTPFWKAVCGVVSATADRATRNRSFFQRTRPFSIFYLGAVHLFVRPSSS